LNLLALTLLLLTFNASAKDEAMTVMYYERPPLYFTDIDGKPRGKMVDLLNAKLSSTKYKVKYKVIPPKRQFLRIEANQEPICGLGWFKNDAREKTGKFSISLLKDKPLVIVTHKDIPFKNDQSVKDFFFRTDLKFLKKDGFSYGKELDELEKKYKVQTHLVTVSTENMVRMLMLRKKYYLFLDVDEIDYILAKDPELKKAIHYTRFNETPDGNHRYLYCTKKVPDEFIKSIK
tara:strand:+ start:333 stop:1031 length:699 start_codon:yes stop_codon:yes gene_type:complete